LSNPSKYFERRVRIASKLGNEALAEIPGKVQARIGRQKDSIEDIKICLKAF
jgi:hypothetical protein